jgi:plasmid stabilization system protein ParE
MMQPAWYEEQSPGPGQQFVLEITQAFEQITEAPERFGPWLGSASVRRFPLKRFPYALLYEIRPDKVRILCARHHKRHPSYGSGRK